MGRIKYFKLRELFIKYLKNNRRPRQLEIVYLLDQDKGGESNG